jgi:8-amino-7-oxononanoate synthase
MVNLSESGSYVLAESLETFAAEKLAQLSARDLRRSPPTTAGDGGMWVRRDGRRLLSFSSNDYLHLSSHPSVREASIDAVRRYGAGSGASYLVTGRHPLYAELEARLASIKGTEAACVFGSGYLANAGIVGALAGDDDVVFLDELSHACMWAGARSSGAAMHAYAHNNVEHLARLLAEHRGGGERRALVLTEGVFSMDGDLAPLRELGALAREFDAWLLTDDAHGFGVVGAGRGSSFAHGERIAVPLQMGTLSKAAGGYGGYLCASRAVVELMKNRARTFVYSTALPPAVVGAAIAALDIIASDAALVARPLSLARRFARRLGLAEPASAIVSLVVGTARRALDAQRRLEDEGFLVVAIRPPTVADGTARLRVTFSAGHDEHDVDALADAVGRHVLA